VGRGYLVIVLCPGTALNPLVDPTEDPSEPTACVVPRSIQGHKANDSGDEQRHGNGDQASEGGNRLDKNPDAHKESDAKTRVYRDAAHHSKVGAETRVPPPGVIVKVGGLHMARVAAVLVGLAVYIWFVVDVVRTPSSTVRTLPKFVWLLIVVLIPLIGGLLWLLGGRPRSERRRRRGPTAPDDDPAFLRRIGDDAWSQRMKRRRDEPEGQAPA
jgi:hypothetical protein